MAFHKVNKIIILRIKPATSIRFRKDLHSAVSSVSAAKKSGTKILPKRLKPQRKNPPHPYDFSTKKSLSSYIPEPMTKVRSLAGQNLVADAPDFKRGWINLSILHFDKYKDVTNKIKSDLISVDNVVKELISFKQNEFIPDMEEPQKRLNDLTDSRNRNIRNVEKPDESDDFEKYEKYEKYEKPSFRRYARDLEEDDRERHTEESEHDDDGRVYSKKNDDLRRNELYEHEERSIEYVPRKRNTKRYFDDEAEDSEEYGRSFSVNLLPVDENTKELIKFKPPEKVTIEELSELNRLGGRVGSIETLLRKRIKKYKPNLEKWETPTNRRKEKRRNSEAIDSSDIRHTRRSPIKFNKYDKNPEKIAKFKKFEEFEEVNENDIHDKRTLRKKTDDSIYFPSYEEYEKAQKYYKDT